MAGSRRAPDLRNEEPQDAIEVASPGQPIEIAESVDVTQGAQHRHREAETRSLRQQIGEDGCGLPANPGKRRCEGWGAAQEIDAAVGGRPKDEASRFEGPAGLGQDRRIHLGDVARHHDHLLVAEGRSIGERIREPLGQTVATLGETERACRRRGIAHHQKLEPAAHRREGHALGGQGEEAFRPRQALPSSLVSRRPGEENDAAAGRPGHLLTLGQGTGPVNEPLRLRPGVRLLSCLMRGRGSLRFAAVVLVGLGGSPPTDAADALGLRVPGVLRVLASADEMPEVFSFAARAPNPGFERELVEGFAKSRRLEMRIVPVKNFDQIIPLLVKGDGDLIVGIVDTATRRQKIGFTSETYPVRHLVVTRKPQPPLTNPAELKSLKVAVIPGTTWADVAAEAGAPAVNLVSCVDANDLLDALKKGRAQATVMAVFDFALAQKYDPALEAGPFLGSPGVAAWGVRKDDEALRGAIDDYLAAVRMSPAKSALLVKYFSEDALVLLRRARKE